MATAWDLHTGPHSPHPPKTLPVCVNHTATLCSSPQLFLQKGRYKKKWLIKIQEGISLLAQAISCSNVRGVFPVHELFWFCLVQVSTTQFCSFPSFLMARVNDGTRVPISLAPASSSNMGSLDGSLPDLEGTGFRASTMEEKITEIYLQLPLFIQSAAGIENCVQTLAQTVAAQTTKITNIEQIVGSHVGNVTSLETNAASGSSSPDSARSSNVLGQSNGSTATGSLGSHGSGSSDDNRNTRRRLDTLQALKTNMHGITNWINTIGKIKHSSLW